MPNAQHPTLPPDYGLKRSPMFVVDVVSYGNQKEQRLLRTPNPRYKITLSWGTLSEQQKNQLQSFFMARKGRWEAFDIIDPDPDSPTYGQAIQVRFVQDQAEYEWFQYNLWRNKVEVVTV
jgi:hypothetical protein